MLRAGIGAKGRILTRMIKPKQILPNDDSDHRSNVEVRGWYASKSGAVYYEFFIEGGDQLAYGAARYVRIVEEGPASEIFTVRPIGCV